MKTSKSRGTNIRDLEFIDLPFFVDIMVVSYQAELKRQKDLPSL